MSKFVSKCNSSWGWRFSALVPGALLGLVDGVVVILTLGTWGTHFQMKWLLWRSEKAATRRKNKATGGRE